MPAFLLIGIPIVVVVLLLGIMSLPDEDKKTLEKVTTSLSAKKKKSQK